MEQLDVNISIIYDDDKREIIQAEIRGEHPLNEIPAILGGFAKILDEWDLVVRPRHLE